MEITVLAYQQNAHKKYLWDKDKRLRQYTKDDLEILIATMDRTELSFLEIIFSKPIQSITSKILVINQGTDKLFSDIKNIRVINDAGYGLSRSRNLAIQKSKGALLWIMDDDCVIHRDGIQNIIDAFNNVSSALITFQTKVLETGRLYWNYPANDQVFNKINENQTLSPEIVFKRDSVKDRVWFDERFGLGAQFQDGENYLFLNQLGKQNISRRFVDKVIVAHPLHNSSMDSGSMRIIYARGAIAQYFNKNILFLSVKYAFFLFRRGSISNPIKLWKVAQKFKQGAIDFNQSKNSNI